MQGLEEAQSDQAEASSGPVKKYANGANTSSAAAADAPEDTDKAAGPFALSAHALEILSRFKIHLLTGDFAKQVGGRRKLAGKFAAATVGCHHLHTLKPESKLAQVLAPEATVIAESATYMVQLKQEQVSTFEANVAEWAQEGGFAKCEVPAGVPEGYLAFRMTGQASISGGG